MTGKPLTPSQVQKEFGHSPQQMRRFEAEGLIKAERTPGGHRRYDPEAVAGMFEKQNTNEQHMTRREGYQEWGTTGLRQWGGSIYEERLRALRGREGRREYREMRLNDPVISAVFFAILNAIKQTSIRIEPASEDMADIEAAEFINTCFFDMSFTWQDQLTFAVEPTLEQGFSLLEVIYKRRLGLNPPKYTQDPARSMYDDGRIGWRKLPPRPAETLAQGSEWDFDENGMVQGVVQQPETTFEGQSNTIYLPIEKLLHFRTTVHPANNPEGLPITRAMYLPYYYSRNIAELEGIGVERDLAGLPVAYMGGDTTRKGENNDYEALKDLVSNIRNDEQAGIVIPYAKMGEGAMEGNGVLLELLSPSSGGGGKQFNTSEILDRYDKLKAISVLAQFIMLGMGNVGSYALSRHQGDIFVLAIGAFLDGIAAVFNRHGIPKLILMNAFPRITGFPELKFSTLGVPDLQTIADFVNKLVDKAVLTPDLQLEQHLRQLADLPQRQEREQVNVRPDPTDDNLAKGIKKKRILKQDPTGLSDAGVEALGETEDLEDEIDDAWEDFRDNVLGGMAIAAAIILFRDRMQELFTQYYTVTWQIARGGAADLGIEGAQIQGQVNRAMGYLGGFMDEMAGELREVGGDQAEQDSLFDRRKARALMYAGGAWAAYNLGRLFGGPADQLYVWDGAPIDASSCDTCASEMPKPPRRLGDMKIPGVQTLCLTSCRHEVRPATPQEIAESRRIGQVIPNPSPR